MLQFLKCAVHKDFSASLGPLDGNFIKIFCYFGIPDPYSTKSPRVLSSSNCAIVIAALCTRPCCIPGNGNAGGKKKYLQLKDLG